MELGWVPGSPRLCAGKESISRRDTDTTGLSFCKSWARAKFQSSSRI